MNKKGKFIVIEGTDGSGKATQSKLLLQRLKKQEKKVAFFDFPQYGKPTCAAVEKYLNGKYGTAQEVGPYRASLLYAVDRYDASFKLYHWLSKGYTVIANRYVASNLAHQGGKIRDSKKRKKYFSWINNLEYKIFQIPKPDKNIILFVDAKISQKLVDGKKNRAYLKGKRRDIHEADLNHLMQTQQVYKELAKLYKKEFTVIQCVKNNQIMTRGEISTQIDSALKKL